ncbi:hypothetical protein [Gordonia metallireducens]|uniref:hypothetical protein n=1 Tax=Gordonia metallireducens TaxID=2897779 RepID=UPI001E51DABB|nr:hypothetical protein [Gordonia metallireducens]
MADTQAWTGGEANDADVVEQTTPVDPVDVESAVGSEVPSISLEADPADVVEQATVLGPDDPDEYPPDDDR